MYQILKSLSRHIQSRYVHRIFVAACSLGALRAENIVNFILNRQMRVSFYLVAFSASTGLGLGKSLSHSSL